MPEAKPQSIQTAKQRGGLMYTFWAWLVVGDSRAGSRNRLFLSARESKRFYVRLLLESEVLVQLLFHFEFNWHVTILTIVIISVE